MSQSLHEAIIQVALGEQPSEETTGTEELVYEYLSSFFGADLNESIEELTEEQLEDAIVAVNELRHAVNEYFELDEVSLGKKIKRAAQTVVGAALPGQGGISSTPAQRFDATQRVRSTYSARRQKKAARREKEGERELKTAEADRGGKPEYETDTVMTDIGRKRDAKYIGYKPSHDDGGLETKIKSTKVGGRTFYPSGAAKDLYKAMDDAEAKKQGRVDAAKSKISAAQSTQRREKKHREGLKFKSLKRKAEALKRSDV